MKATTTVCLKWRSQLLCIFFYLIIQNNYSQVTPVYSPEGKMETVFDRFGYKYTLDDVRNTPKKHNKTGTSLRSNLLCSPGIFNLYFEAGCGADGGSATAIARRAVFCQVFQDVSDMIQTPLKSNGGKVNIWIRNITQMQGYSNSHLGLASGFYNLPGTPNIINEGIADNEIWKTIHAGADSYTNTVNPIFSNDGQSLNFYHGVIGINFAVYPLNTNLNSSATASQYDLYSVLLHEITHTLGFNSLIGPTGTSLFGADFNYYNRYDTFLRTSNGQPLISNGGCNPMYGNFFMGDHNALHPGCTLPGFLATSFSNNTVCSTAIHFNGTVDIPVYTPQCYERTSSLSHFEDSCYLNTTTGSNYGNDQYFAMCNGSPIGTTKRFLKQEEWNALCDIGYSLNPTFGSAANLSFQTYNSGTGCGGTRIAGINDGFEPDNTYSFIGEVNTDIVIDHILDNDITYNAFPYQTDNVNLRYECVEDVFDSSTVITLAGNDASGTITINTATPAVHLLRYVPFNVVTGQRGNITYVFVQVNETPTLPNSQDIGANFCGVPSVCDLVVNGNFETISEPINSLGQLKRACNWMYGNNGSPDLFRQGALFINGANPLGNPNVIGIPTNTFGMQQVNNGNGSTYAGIWGIRVHTSGQPYYEVLTNRLAAPLLANTTYTLRFDVSLSDNNSANPMQFQAYLGNNEPIWIGNNTGNIPQEANGILLSHNDNLGAPFFITDTQNWTTVTFSFQTGATAGQEFLYIGGILNPAFSNMNSPVNVGSYYYVDNVSLIPTYNADINLPTTLCNTQAPVNLNNLLMNAPGGGVYTGTGVSQDATGDYFFDPAVAGNGTHTISFTFTDNLGCPPITITDTVVVNGECATPYFSQAYVGTNPNDAFVEVKNQSLTQSIPAGKYFMALYANGATGATVPTSFVDIGVLAPGEAKVFRNPAATAPAYAVANSTAWPAGFTFDGTNDVLVLTTATNIAAWTQQIDLMGNSEPWCQNTTMVRSSCAMETPRPYNYLPNEWVAFTLNEMDTTYGNTSKTNAILGRHQSEVLVFDLGAGWNDESVDESNPDRSRQVRIAFSYSTATNGSFECCSLEINSLQNLIVTANHYVSVQTSINAIGDLIVENQGSLVMVKDEYNGVAGNDLIQLGSNGGITVNQSTVGIDATTDYVFWASPLSLHPSNLPQNSINNLFPSGVFNSDRFFGFNNANYYDGKDCDFDPITSTVICLDGTDGFDDNRDDYYVVPASERAALMIPGRGYASWPPAGTTIDYNVQFQGQTNNGVVTVPVYRNDSPYGGNMNLVGNPYPCAIDLDRLFAVNDGLIDPMAFVWGRTAIDNPDPNNPGPDPVSYTEDNFMVYNPTMMVLPSGSNNPAFNSEGLLSSCQSFFVTTTTQLPEGNSGSISLAGNLVFNNSMRSTAPNTTFSRQSATTSPYGKLWLNLRTVNGTRAVQMGVAFPEHSTAGYSAKEDVIVPSGRHLSLYSQSGGQDLIIDAHGSFNPNQVIPLGMISHLPAGESLQLSLDKVEGLDGQPVYILDTTTGVLFDISQNPFIFTPDTAVIEGRYSLVFSSDSITDYAKPADTIEAICKDGIVTVRVMGTQQIKTVEVYDCYTTALRSAKVSEYANGLTKEATVKVGTGVKLLGLRILLDDGTLVTKKIMR